MQAAQLVSVVGNGAQCAFKIGTASAAAATNAACGGCFTAQLAFAQADQFRCCAAYATQLAAYSAQLAALAVIYGVANQTYKRARVCGHDWQVWSNNDQVDANNKKIWSRGNYAGSYAKCLTDLFGKILSIIAETLKGNFCLSNHSSFSSPQSDLFKLLQDFFALLLLVLQRRFVRRQNHFEKKL